MLGWSINLFRVRGIQLALHFSFVLWLAYAALQGYQGGGIEGMLFSVGALLVFFTCVVLHEFGHSFTARHFGVGVRRILLMPIGGMAEFDSIPREPKKELLITIAGPAVNFAIAGVLALFVGLPGHLWGFSDNDDASVVSDLVRQLLKWNLWMGLFNLVPAFPMDGGRILRALLATRLTYLRATYWAATLGKVIGGIGIAYALWHDSYVLAALFAFILFAGDTEYRLLLRREREEAHWRMVAEQHRVFRPASPPGEEPPLLPR